MTELKSLAQGCWEEDQILVLADFLEENNVCPNLATLIRMIEAKIFPDLELKTLVFREVTGEKDPRFFVSQRNIIFAGGGKIFSNASRPWSYQFDLVYAINVFSMCLTGSVRESLHWNPMNRSIIRYRRPQGWLPIEPTWDFHDCLVLPFILFWTLRKEYVYDRER